MMGTLAQSGAVYVYGRTPGGWDQQAYIKAAVPALGANFGHAIALDGVRLLVGAPGENSNATGVNGDQSNADTSDSGATYLFNFGGAGWTQQAYIKASTVDQDDGFGTAVALDGRYIAVSSRGEDGSSTGSNGDESNNSTPDSGATFIRVVSP